MRTKFYSISRLVVFGVLTALTLAASTLGWQIASPSTALAAAGINQQINFQARLFNAQGAVVADGNYNIEFKIYQDGDGCNPTSGTSPCGGTLKWTEAWLNNNSQGVTVRNGYFSLQLGSITSLATVDFNQSVIWLSMNVGNTNTTCTPFSSCAGDGEMKPFQRFGSNAYSFNSDRLGGLQASSFGQLSANQTYTGTNLFKNSSATAFTIQNAGGTITALNADGSTGNISINGVLQTAPTAVASTPSNALSLQSGNATGTTSNSGNVTLDSGTATGTTGIVNIGTTNASAINIGHGAIGVTIPTSASLTLGASSGAKLGSIKFFNGANANTITLQSGATASTFALTLPTATGTAGQCVTTTDSAGTLAFASCAGGGGSGAANTALSNLASVAINTSLLPGTAGTINLGSGALPFGELFLAGSSGTPASNNFRFTGASTSGTRILTLPDAAGTITLGSGFTVNGVSYASNSTTIATTPAGTTGQCLVATTGSAPSFASCAGGGSGVTLQAGYDNGTGAITTSNAKDLAITLADFATDPNFTVNIATSSTGKFAVQNNGTDLLRVTTAGGTVVNTGGLTVSAGGETISAGGLNVNSTGITNAGTIGGVTTVSGGGAVTLQSGGTSDLTLSSASGNLVSGNRVTRNLTRTLPIVVNDEVDVGDFALTNGAGAIEVWVTVPSVGFSVAKHYLLPIAFNETANVYQTAQPIADSGPFSGQDFALDVRVNSATVSLRLRRTAGSTAGTAYVVTQQQGVNTDTFTPSVATSSVAAPAAFYSGTALTQVNGNVGIGTATAPAALLSVGSSSQFQINSSGAIAAAAGITSSGAITLSNLATTGIVHNSAAGLLSTSLVNLNSGGDTTGTLTVGSGGTGAGSFTQYQIPYGNGTAALGVTTGGSAGQCLTFQNAAAPIWASCGGTGSGVTLQAGYDNSGVTELVLNNTNKALTVRDNSTPITSSPLLEVQNNAGTTTYFSVGASGNTAANSFGVNGTVDTVTATNSNASSTAATVNAVQITPVGGANANTNANTLNAINFPNVTTVANNAFYGLNFGTGYNDLFRYNGAQLISGLGKLQNAALDNTLTYSNLTKVGTLTVGALGSGFTAVNVAQGGTGLTTLTSNGILFGNGTSNVGVTAAAGSAGQCLVSTVGNPVWGSCSGTGSGATLQAAFDNGNTISTAAYPAGRDIAITLADQTTDSNFTVNIATGSTSKFAVQNNGTDLLAISTTNGTVVNTGNFNVQAGPIQTAGTTRITNAGALTNVSYAGSTIAVGNGGTGTTSFTANQVLFGNGGSAIGATTGGSAGQCLVAQNAAAPIWAACAGTGSGATLQAGYDNSGVTELVLNNTNKALTVRDNSTPITGSPLLEVQNNAGTTTYFKVDATTGVTINSTLSGGTTYTAATSLQAPLLDTASATTLNIGTNNATDIVLQKPVSITSGAGLTLNGGLVKQNGYELADAATNNLLVNGDFEQGTYGWTGVNSAVPGGYSGNQAGQITTQTANILSDDYIPVDPVRDVLQLEGYFKKTVAGSVPGVIYFGYIAYDSAKAVIGTSPCGSYCYFAAAGIVLPADSAWHKYSATTTGEGAAFPNFPVGTKYVRVLVLGNYGSTGATTLMDHVTLRRINNGPLFVGNNFNATNMTDQQQTSSIYTNTSGSLIVDAGSTGGGLITITNAGAISGVTTLNTSGVITSVGLNAGAGNITQTAGSTISAGTGFKINGAAAGTGQYLRGDGTNFVSSAIQAADIPTGSGNYIQNQNAGAQATANFNISGSGTLGGNLTATGALTIGTRDASNTYATIDGLRVGGDDQGNTLYNGAKSIAITADSGQNVSLCSVSDCTKGLNLQTSTGNVGIGTTSPTEKLHVYNGNEIIDLGNLKFTTLAPPGAPTVAASATAGNPNGTYTYVVTFVTSQGETAMGTVSAPVSPVSKQVNLTAIPTGTAGVVTQRKIYRTFAGGGPYYFVATLADNTTTTYTDNTADASLTVLGNANNTTGGRTYLNGAVTSMYDPYSANTSNGYAALSANTSGSYNTAQGYAALTANTIGIYNTAVGGLALVSNTIGNFNVATGMQTLSANTTGSLNTASGYAALLQNKSGSNNAAFGYAAGQGVVNSSDITGNALFGYGTGSSLLTGGNYNTLIGYAAGNILTTGTNNTFVGVNAGINATTGSNNIIIGQNVNAPVAASSNQLNIGNTIYGDLSTGKISIGTSTISDKLHVSGGDIGIDQPYAFKFANGQTIRDNGGAGLTVGTTTSTATINLSTTNGNILLSPGTANVGIGTASPSAKLNVSGNSYFQGDIGSTGLSGLQSQANNFNVVPNSSFEVKTNSTGTDPDGWVSSSVIGNGTSSTTRASDAQSDGTYSMKSVLTGTTSFSQFIINSFIPVKPSTDYMHAVDVKHDTTANNCTVGMYLRVDWYNTAQGLIASSDTYANAGTTTSWTTYSGTVTSPATAAFAKVEYYSINNTGACTRWFDNSVFRPVGFAGNLAVSGIITASSTSNSVFGNGTTGGIQIGDGTITKTSGNIFQFNSAVNAATGYQIGGAAATGNYLRGNGTNFVSSAIQAADIPTGSANYIQNQNAGAQATANFNISGSGTAATSFITPTLTTASGDLTIDPTGNTIIKGSTSVTGTAAVDIQNSTASILYARNDGNIGIGTTAPASTLDTYGEIQSGSVYSRGNLAAIGQRKAYYSLDGSTINSSEWANSATGVTQNNKFVFAGGDSTWTQGITSKATFPRSQNLVFEADVKNTSNGYLMLGWKDNDTASFSYANGQHYTYFVTGGGMGIFESASQVNTPSFVWTTGTTYRVRTVLNASGGAAYYISSNGGRTWTTLWTGSTTNTTSPLRLGITYYQGGWEVDNIEVYSTSGADTIYGSAGNVVEIAGNLGIGTTDPSTGRLVLQGATSDATTAALNIQNSGAVSTLYVRNDGNVGIGTTAPGAKLSIAGGVGVPALYEYDAGAGLRFGSGIQSSELQNFVPVGSHFSFNSGGDLQASGTNELVRIQSDGKVGIGTIGPLSKLDVNGNLAVGTYAGTTAAPTNGLIVSGNVGIGSTAPQAKLEVVGNIISAGTSWTSRTSPVNNTWNSVAYGNGLFVAVSGGAGTGNRIMTSPDGINWTSRVSTGDHHWTSVTYGNGLFVAVACGVNVSSGCNNTVGNRVMTSPDGITWTSRDDVGDKTWSDVTYGNGLFVAVSGADGASQVIMTSPDGINWTLRTGTSVNGFSSVAYGNGKFVAIFGTVVGSTASTSPDGITWTSQTVTQNQNWNSITYGNGLFVSVASNGVGNRVITSSDGVTWTSRSSAADNQWNSITYGNGLFVVVADSGVGNRVMTSPDGISWAIRSSAADTSWNGIAYGNGVFAAVATSGQIMTSGIQDLQVTPANNIYQGGMSINGQLTVLSSSSPDATIGSSLLTGNCTGTNWSGTGTGPYTHTSGSAVPLTCTITGGVTAGSTYRIIYTSSPSNSTTTISGTIGGVSAPVATGAVVSMTAVLTATSTSNPTFTPSVSTDTGSISGISIALVTNSNPVISVQNNSSYPGIEVRAGGGLNSDVYIGVASGQSSTSGSSFNSGFGYKTLQSNTTGSENTSIGAVALEYNTTGISNTAVGFAALQVNTLGDDNTAVGFDALLQNTTGDNNVAVGEQALHNNTTGVNNTAIGAEAGYTSVFANANATGSRNTFIGYNAGPGTPTQLTDATAIGERAVVSQSNSLVLGCIISVNGCIASTSVGIGASAPATTLQVSAANTFTGNFTGTTLATANSAITTTNVQGTDIGGTLGLGGTIDNAATTSQLFGAIKGAKENATTGGFQGYLSFFTSSNSFGSALVERARISSAGNFGINTTAPLATLDVNGSARFNGDLLQVGAAANGLGDSGSMVPNSGFEINADADATMADGWTFPGGGTVAVTSTSPAQGTSSQTITSTTAQGPFIKSACFPITGGRAYNLYTRVKASVATTQGLYVRLQTYATKPNCIADTSGTNNDSVINGAVTTTYTDYGGSVTPATTQLWASVELYNFLPNVGSTFTYDSVRLTPAQLTSGVDLAEHYIAGEPMTPGDVVAIAEPLANVKKTTKAYDQAAIGVYSTDPGITLGNPTSKTIPVALSGRVPVKVAPDSAPIATGDFITTSTTPGRAMKAAAAGQMIGKALEAWTPGTGQNTVTIFVTTSYADPVDHSLQVSDQVDFASLNVTGQGKFGSLVVAGTITTQDLAVTGTATIGSVTVVGTTTTQDLNVIGTATVGTLKAVTIESSGDIKLAGVGNTRNAITKKYKATKPIAAGSVVIADPDNDGQVTTTTAKADSKVIGIAASDAATAGDDIEVAIGGSIQVKFDAATAKAGNLLISSDQEGSATTAVGDPKVGTVIGKATGQKDPAGLVWLLVTLQ